MKTVYTVAYKPVFANNFQYFRTFSALKEAKRYVALEKEQIHKNCGRYNLEDHFRIIERLENESIKL